MLKIPPFLRLLGLMLGLMLLAGPGSAAGQDKPWTGKLADGTVIDEDDLKKLLREHRKWFADILAQNQGQDPEAILKKADLWDRLAGADLSGADLSETDLFKADIADANLIGANLFQADLTRANLFQTNLTGAYLFRADLTRADLSRANLTGADLSWADLTGADLTYSNLSNARLSGADFLNATYESVSGLPDKNYIGGLKHLETLKYTRHDGYGNMVLLRNAMKEVGLRDSERQLTYAIENGKLEHLPWSDPANWAERGFRTVFFLWPCDFGLHPGRPIGLMLRMMPIFALFYYLALRIFPGLGGIYQILPADKPAYSKRLRPKAWAAVGWALYFSLLSACRIGWRELNPGSWIVNMQRQDYLLKPTHWVRLASGLQALISVYLLALAVLTYFGRPFE